MMMGPAWHLEGLKGVYLLSVSHYLGTTYSMRYCMYVDYVCVCTIATTHKATAIVLAAPMRPGNSTIDRESWP